MRESRIQKYEYGQNRVSAARLFEMCSPELTLSSMFDDDTEGKNRSQTDKFQLDRARWNPI
jgi:hypothetical protein